MERAKSLIFLIVFLFFSIIASAQVFVESENDITFTANEDLNLTGTIFVSKNFTDNKFGFSNFVLVSKGWAEITPSLTYSEGRFKFNAGIGIETAKPFYRTTFGVFYADNLNVGKAFFEKGGGSGNYWYHLSLERSIGKFSYGVMSRRFYGTGLRLGVNLDRGVKLQIAPLYDFESSKFRSSIFLTYCL